MTYNNDNHNNNSEYLTEPEGSILMENEIQSQEDALREEIKTLNERLLLALADFENLKKRTEKQREEDKKYAHSSFVKSFLVVVDNLQLAIQHIPQEFPESMKSFIEGVKMTFSHLEHTLESAHIKKIAPHNGDPFDYRNHQAVQQTVTDEVAPGSVVLCLQPGYIIHDRILRPAMVTVAESGEKNTQHSE